MNVFEFRGKKYIPVQDRVTELVIGCKKCAFYSQPQECYAVDADKEWADRCGTRSVHYEEVKSD